MVSEVMEQRFNDLFQSLDTNGDGLIDDGDFEAVLKGLTARRGFQPGSPEHDGMRMQIMSGWERLRELADADEDGRVTREEFLRAYSKMSESPEGMEQTSLALAEQMIVANDTDGDGRLNFEEYQGMMGAWGAPADKMQTLFDHMDTDGDGYVTREELLASVRRFFSGESTGYPHLWGGS